MPKVQKAEKTQKIKNQHYVPQGYLEEFTCNGKQLFVFDKFTQKSYLTHTKNIASDRYFYDFHPDIQQDFQDEVAIRGYSREDAKIIEKAFDPQLVEHEMSNIESAFYRNRDDLLSAINLAGCMKSEQKTAIAYYMTIQLLRTPEARRNFLEFQEKLIKELGTKFVDNDEFQIEYDQRYGSLEHARYMFDPEMQQASTQILCNHIWVVGINQTSHLLYTSDTPVVIQAHSAQYRGIGVGVPGVEIAFPLTPRHVLILWERKFFRKLRLKIAVFNLYLLIRLCTTTVYRFLGATAKCIVHRVILV